MALICLECGCEHFRYEDDRYKELRRYCNNCGMSHYMYFDQVHPSGVVSSLRRQYIADLKSNESRVIKMSVKFKDIVKTQKQVLKAGYHVQNNILTTVDVDIIAHFGNCTCLKLMASNVSIMQTRNTTKNLGILLSELVEFIGVEEEDGKLLSDIRNVPIRIIFDGDGGPGSKCIGFGHFMKDKFVYTDDFARIDE